MKSILRIIGYTRRYPVMATLQLLCAIGGTLLVVVFPGVTREILDQVIPFHQWERLPWLLLIAAGGFFGRDLLECLRIQLNNTFEQKVIFDLRSDLYAKIQRLPLSWFDQRATGDIMTRVVEDVTSVERVIIDGIEQGLVAALQIIVVGSFMFLIQPSLAAVACLPIPLLLLGALAYTWTARDRHRKVRKATSEMNSLLHDNISGIRQIKAYAAGEREHAHFNQYSNALRVATLHVMRVWSYYKPGMTFLNATGFLLVIWFGARAAMFGEISPGDLAAFLFILTFFYEPVGRLHQLNQLLQSGRAAGERVFEIMDTPDEPGWDEGKPLVRENVTGHVVYQNVGFSYSGEMTAIHNISMEALPGQTIALVGETGAGKSTLVHLLNRFYEYDSGEILLDGVPLHHIQKEDLRACVGYVTQESFLFNGTIRDNLLLGQPDANDQQMWDALEAAHAKDFVTRMPHGLDTEVGERGVRLSVGEKQRLSLARMVLKNPPIVVLDEATASVDNETESLIQAALDHIMKNRTCFVIAHRLSTVRHADRIYVIDKGHIIEQGRHEELLRQGGVYAKLCRISFPESEYPQLRED